MMFECYQNVNQNESIFAKWSGLFVKSKCDKVMTYFWVSDFEAKNTLLIGFEHKAGNKVRIL